MITQTITEVSLITNITGVAKIRLPNGALKELKAGDTLQPGTVVLLDEGVQLTLKNEDTKGEHQDTTQTTSADIVTADNNSPANDIAQLQQNILNGVDPTKAFEAAAAGTTVDAGGGVGSGNGGFVSVARSGDTTIAESGYDTSVVSSSTSDLSLSASNPSVTSNSGVDTTPPSITVDAPALTNDSTPTITGATDLPAGSFVTLQVTDSAGGQQTFTAIVQTDGTYQVDVPVALAEGNYSVVATATDMAGNSAKASDNGLLDTTAPAAPVITTVMDDVAQMTGQVAAGTTTNDNTPTLGGTAEANATVNVYDGTRLLGTVQADKDGNWTLPLTTALADGAHSITAVAVDPAGNTGLSSAAYGFSVDTAAPAAPVITTVMDDVAQMTGQVAAGTTTNDNTPTLGGTAEANATVNVYDGTRLLGTVQADTDGNWTLPLTTALADGAHSITAVAMDPAGNTGLSSTAYGFSVDTAAPAAPVITTVMDDVAQMTGQVAAGTTTNDNTPTLGGTAEANATVNVYDGTRLLGTVQADTDGNWTLPLTTALADGAHSITAVAVDLAGNTGLSSAAYGFSVDTQLATPSVSLTNDSGTKGDLYTNDAALTFSTPAEAVTRSYTISDGTTTTTGPSYVAPTTDGHYTVTVKDIDLAGNEKSGNLSFTLDTHLGKPTVSFEQPSHGLIYNATDVGSDGTVTATINVAGSSVGDTLSYSVNGGQAISVILDAAMISNGVSVQVVPRGSVSASLSDNAGNSTYTAQTAPAADVVSPTITQTVFTYNENKSENATVATLEATDSSGVASYQFKWTDGSLHSTTEDGYFSINSNGVITITSNGAKSSANDFDAPNSTDNNHGYDVVIADNVGNITKSHITLSELNVNEAPVNTVPSSLTNVQEDIPYSITGLSVKDVDGNLSSVQLSVGSGSLSVTLTAGVSISSGSNGSSSFTLSGTEAQINAALETLTYQGTKNFSGADTLTVVSTDSAGTPLSDTDSVNITVNAVADTPTLVLSGYSSLTSTGLLAETWYIDKTAMGTYNNGNGVSNDIVEAKIESAGAAKNSSIILDAANSNVSVDTVTRISGLVYLEAGKSYVFSGKVDDSFRLEIGGATVANANWGANSGAYTSSAYVPTVSGYYTVTAFHYNENGLGNYDINVSINSATAVDFNSTNFNLFTSVADITSKGIYLSDEVLNSSGEGGYYTVESINHGNEDSWIPFSKISAALMDSDGSETLTVSITGLLEGTQVKNSDGTILTSDGSGVLTLPLNWDLSQLQIKAPHDYSGTMSLTVIATSSENNGSTASSSKQTDVTVDPVADANVYGHIVYDSSSGHGSSKIYSYHLDTQAYTTDSSESLSNITLTGLPSNISGLADGSSSITISSGTAVVTTGHTITITSSTLLTDSQINAIQASVTSTDGLVSHTVMVGHTGTNGIDSLSGTSADEWFSGLAGNDIINAGDGANYLDGGAGDDTLTAGAGKDMLIGGLGNDILTGGADHDIFKWTASDVGTGTNHQTDTIKDFTISQGDQLDLKDVLSGTDSLDKYLSFGTSGNNAVVSVHAANSNDTTLSIVMTGHASDLDQLKTYLLNGGGVIH